MSAGRYDLIAPVAVQGAAGELVVGGFGGVAGSEDQHGPQADDRLRAATVTALPAPPRPGGVQTATATVAAAVQTQRPAQVHDAQRQRSRRQRSGPVRRLPAATVTPVAGQVRQWHDERHAQAVAVQSVPQEGRQSPFHLLFGLRFLHVKVQAQGSIDYVLA